MIQGIVLYGYQELAVETMVDSNLLLAFDPGLGKTISTIAAVEKLRHRGEVTGPGAVVAPVSLKYQWAREIHRYTDRTAVVVDGTPAKRAGQYTAPCDYLVMGYDQFVKDWDLHKHVRAFLVVDEASALRGFSTKRTKHFKKVRGNYPVRFALTATPIENGKPDELFNILEWLDPEILGKHWDFERKYVRRNNMGWIEGYRNLGEFHKEIAPYVIRMSHDDPEVASVLPAVVHKEPLAVRLDQYTARVHSRMVEDLLADLDQLARAIRDSGRAPEHVDGKLMAKIQALRMFLDHPALIPSHAGSNAAAARTLDAFPAFFGRDRLPTPKLHAFAVYLDEFLDAHPGNKVVVFTCFVEMAERLASICSPYGAVVFHGGMSAKSRDRVKNLFATDENTRVFVSTDAGGYGLDLPEANLVINYDLPWSAGMLAQRNGRIRRASSAWGHVTIQDVVVEGTLEERMLQMLTHKMAVADAVLAGEGITESGDVSSDLDTLRSFLSQGEGVE